MPNQNRSHLIILCVIVFIVVGVSYAIYHFVNSIDNQTFKYNQHLNQLPTSSKDMFEFYASRNVSADQQQQMYGDLATYSQGDSANKLTSAMTDSTNQMMSDPQYQNAVSSKDNEAMKSLMAKYFTGMSDSQIKITLNDLQKILINPEEKSTVPTGGALNGQITPSTTPLPGDSPTPPPTDTPTPGQTPTPGRTPTPTPTPGITPGRTNTPGVNQQTPTASPTPTLSADDFLTLLGWKTQNKWMPGTIWPNYAKKGDLALGWGGLADPNAGGQPNPAFGIGKENTLTVGGAVRNASDGSHQVEPIITSPFSKIGSFYFLKTPIGTIDFNFVFSP